MNQTEILALMRADLEAVGIEPGGYLESDTLNIPAVFTQFRLGDSMLSNWLSRCPYRSELIDRLYKFAKVTGQGHSTFGNVVMSQAMYQAATKRITLDEFLERLLEARDTEDFMTRLITR